MTVIVDPFPWPQSRSPGKIAEVAALATVLWALRREVMAAHDSSPRRPTHSPSYSSKTSPSAKGNAGEPVLRPALPLPEAEHAESPPKTVTAW